MRKFGAERVSKDAKKELSKELEKHAGKITTEAKKYASMAGRKTIRAEDIKFVVKKD